MPRRVEWRGEKWLFCREEAVASTAVENVAMRRVLEKVGLAFEGVMRAFMPRQSGRRDDYALYAVTRSEWERTREGLG
jgi:RimJ/RimL family protein N-acetyltransferase